MRIPISLVTCFLISCNVIAQISTDSTRAIEITFNKTSSLVFPSVIKSVDRGSRDVLAQIVKGSENVLQLKAARPGFTETNLTVITADQLLHQFRITYSREPARLFHALASSTPNEPTLVQFKSETTEEQLKKLSEKCLVDNSWSIDKVNRNHKMKLRLQGIYVHSEVMFFKIELCNKSNISYDTEYLRFFVKDKVKSRRTASQEIEMLPLFVNGNKERIAGRSSEDIVVATDKFTISDAKRLTIEVFEKNGGRHLHLKIKNARIVKAKLI